MTRSVLVVCLAVAVLAPGSAAAELLSFETSTTEPDESKDKKDGSLGFVFRYLLPTGTEPYLTGNINIDPEAASLAYGLGFRQAIRLGPLQSLLALKLTQVATDAGGPEPPRAGLELGVPLGNRWSVDAVGGYQLPREDVPPADREFDWFARAQLSFRPGF